MFLKIKKISKYALKDGRGAVMKVPGTDEKIVEEEELNEAIDVNMIKAIRPFTRRGNSHANIKGDISVIYFKPQPDKHGEMKTAELHVVGNYEQLVDEINRLRQGDNKEPAGTN